MSAKVSLVIPNQNSNDKLSLLLNCIIDWDTFPNEIVIIDSSSSKLITHDHFDRFCQLNKINLKILHKKNLYPGAARNIGIKESANSLVGFLDVLTLPHPKWLSDSLREFSDESVDGVWGYTEYQTSNRFEEIVRAATYGVLPVKTLPGSLIKKNTFSYSGLFIESTRAGEDSDWIARVNLHCLNFKDSSYPTAYSGLKGLSLVALIKKWYRNYLFGSKLPYLNAHKGIYFYAAGISLLVIAFNWNSLSYNAGMNGWDLSSPTYIPNVTKISFALLSSLYFLVRGIYIPRLKGVPWKFLLPVNIFPLIFISLILDVVKTFSFIKARLSSLYS